MNLKDFKSYFYDGRFYFKLIFGLFLIGTIIYHGVEPMISGIEVPIAEQVRARNWQGFTIDKGDYTLNFFSFFTIQTNLMVGLGFLFSAIFHNQEGKKDSIGFGQYMTLAITIFISITGIVFNTMLLGTVLNQTGFGFGFSNTVEHIISPIVMVVYFLFFIKREKSSVVESKVMGKKYLGKYFAFPIIGLIVMLIRGEFRYQAGKAFAYQYFFINMHESSKGLPGGAWLIIAAIFIALIIFLLSTWFNSISYKQVNKKLKK